MQGDGERTDKWVTCDDDAECKEEEDCATLKPHSSAFFLSLLLSAVTSKRAGAQGGMNSSSETALNRVRDTTV